VALDSAVDPIVNPDNLGASATTLVIQEDQNWENRKKGYSDVWAWSFATGALTKVARVNVPDKLAQTAGGATGNRRAPSTRRRSSDRVGG
jgi:hypothetical protein